MQRLCMLNLKQQACCLNKVALISFDIVCARYKGIFVARISRLNNGHAGAGEARVGLLGMRGQAALVLL